MGFRFRKSINIIPGVRLNLSNGAPSLSVGPRGASVSFGSRGTYANLGLPGTGQAQIGIGPPATKRNGSTSRPDTQARCTVTQVEANARNNVDRLSEPEPHYDFLNDAGSR